MKRKILLVDDEPAILEVLRSALELKGYEINTANSGGEARRKLDDERFDLVVTDMKMETETAGLAVLECGKLQAYRPIVVLLTAYPSLEPVWLEKGGDATFVKGTGIENILRGIKQLLDSSVTPAEKKVG